MGPAAEKAIPALIEALDGDSFVAHTAMEALGAMGSLAKPAVAPLVRKFEKTTPEEREADYHKLKILEALEQIGPGAVEAVPRLMEWLPQNPMAVRVLGRIGPGAKAAVPVLEKTYATDTGYAKAWSAFALVKITGKTEPYVASLAAIYQKSKITERRREALEVLVELGPDARAALPVFIQAVKEKGERGFPVKDSRYKAAKALARFGPEAREAVPSLIDMVQNSYYVAKIAAAEALGAMGPDAKAAIPALEKMAEEDSRYVPIVEKALAKIRGK
jgi:HEAT repeat protein